jgi:hypothetical protein
MRLTHKGEIMDEKDTQDSSAVPQKAFVSFMVYNMAGNQRERFQSFCTEKGFNYGPAITYLLDHYLDFKKSEGKL